MDFDTPSDSNGYVTLCIDKLEAVISYIAERTNYLFKVKLMKMLWYVDALACKMFGQAITGLVYCHKDLGALPIGHNSIMNLAMLNIQEEESRNYDIMIHIYPTKEMDYSVLSEKDMLVLDKVIDKFKNYRAGDIVDYMHEEIAYSKTRTGDIIPFSLAKKISGF